MDCYEAIQTLLREKPQCGICGLRVTGSQETLDRHVFEAHTGDNRTVLVKTEPKILERPTIVSRVREKGQNERHEPAVIRRVQLMMESQPARVRYTGGVFTSGPLASKDRTAVAGLPRYFGTAGRLKAAYSWIKDLANPILDAEDIAAMDGSLCMEKGSLIFQKPPPFMNESFRVWEKPADAPYTIVKTNLFTADKWPDWGQKVDPTWIAPSLKQCDGCTDNICDCITTKIRQEIPKVVKTKLFGDGLESTADYSPGDLIAELLGEIVPPNKYEDDMAADIVRTDLGKDEDPNVCQVYTRYVGNWSRKINHSCNGGAIFQNVRLSGKWRMVFKATRVIRSGEPLTIHYGPYYWKGKEDQCKCGSEKCVSKRAKGKAKGKT